MRILSETGDIKARMAAAVARENMEEGELSSGSDDGGGLGGYTPLERPVNPKPHFQPKTQTQGESFQLLTADMRIEDFLLFFVRNAHSTPLA